MDLGCLTLTFIMLCQMSLILFMLNPVYDVRKIINWMNDHIIKHKKTYYSLIATYFFSVVILGMYIPLQNIHTMIFSEELDDYDKLILLSRVEKNYIIAGFSLFLVVVLCGMRSLLAYTANLAHIVDTEPKLVSKSSDKDKINDENFLPNLLRVKRSISYEAFLCTNELKDDLREVMKNLKYQQYKNIVSSIFDVTNNQQVVI